MIYFIRKFLFILNLLVLREENMRLKEKNKELEHRLEMVTKELLDMQDLNKTILAINEEFGRENDGLYEKLQQYKSLRKPRSMQVRKKRDHSDSEDEIPPQKRIAFREDSNDPTSSEEDTTKANELSARVRIIFKKFFYTNI